MKKWFAMVVLAASACGGGGSTTDNCSSLETCCTSLSGTDQTTCKASVTSANNVATACMQALAGYQTAGQCGGTAAINHSPVISALTFSPTTVTVGQSSMVMASFMFSDIDGDVKESHTSLTTPSGDTQMFDPTPLSASGAKTGTISATLTLTLPTAGKYVFVITLVDEAGNESNAVTGTLTAQ